MGHGRGSKRRIGLLVAAVLALAAPADAWRDLSPGLEIESFDVPRPSGKGDATVTILRIHPDDWDLSFTGTSLDDDSKSRTAREWCESHGFTAAINAGMFATDRSTHIGYLRFRDHVNNDHVNIYRSLVAFDRLNDAVPRFRIFDLDTDGVTIDTVRRDYASTAQNLRLIKRPGENRWGQQEKVWSEAALGEDDAGRILFIMCRDALTMHDFNNALLDLDIGIQCAQHLEGGPEAQLYIKTGDFELEVFGSYETGFLEGNLNTASWPIPNVFGIRPREKD